GGVNDPASEADLGDRFLLRHGFTVAWVGWEFDIPDQPGLMRIHAPTARDGSGSISGIVRATFTPSAPAAELVVPDLLRYDAIDPEGADSQLQVRSAFLAKGEPIARGGWRVKGHTVTLDAGFEPGKTYEIAYRAANPPVAGLGLVAM